MDAKVKHIRSEELVKRYQNGEEQALKLLIRRFHPTMIRIICHQICTTGQLEDIAQECWYVIIPKLAGLELKISFEVWAITIARRKAIDWICEQQRSRDEARTLQADYNHQSQIRNHYSTVSVPFIPLKKCPGKVQR